MNPTYMRDAKRNANVLLSDLRQLHRWTMAFNPSYTSMVEKMLVSLTHLELRINIMDERLRGIKPDERTQNCEN